MLDKIDELKKMILDVMKNQSVMNKSLEEMKKEIQDTKQEMRKEIQDTKQEMKKMKKEIDALIQRMKKLEESFKNSRNAQISCFKDLISKMEKLDL
jgi:peptidoglycan hydrolase CwlO-like protein